jgi:hypothetical protein
MPGYQFRLYSKIQARVAVDECVNNDHWHKNNSASSYQDSQTYFLAFSLSFSGGTHRKRQVWEEMK